jgi:hypothetical protein
LNLDYCSATWSAFDLQVGPDVPSALGHAVHAKPVARTLLLRRVEATARIADL